MQPNSASFKWLSVVVFVALGAHAFPPKPTAAAVARRAYKDFGIVFDAGHVASTPTPTVTVLEQNLVGVSEPAATTTTATTTTIGDAETATTSTLSASTSNTQTASSGSDYMAIVEKWRSKGGLPALDKDSALESNALKTSTDSVGGLIHELNPGTMAQVLAPGNPDNFENVYVGGWLCEIPTLPGLDGICDTASQGWAYDGQTGHAAILTSTSYSRIGCAIASSTGVWACDLA